MPILLLVTGPVSIYMEEALKRFVLRPFHV